MNNQYEEERKWFHRDWLCCIPLNIVSSSDGYDYPEHVVESNKNDTTNWKKIKTKMMERMNIFLYW